MRIDAGAGSAPFAQRTATVDQPSRSFADFLGDRNAQGGRAPDQASGFDAKGLFGSGGGIAAQSQSPRQPSDLGGKADLTNGRRATPAPDSAGELLTSQPANLNPESHIDEEIVPLAVSADEGNGTGSAQLPGPSQSLDELWIGEPSVDLGEPARSPTRPPNGPNVLLIGQGESIDLFVTSSPLSVADREALRRSALQALAEHGEQPGELRLNGELLAPPAIGEIHGRFRG